MPWSDACATGVARLDQQHQRLFQLVEDFQAALVEGGGERVYGGLLHLLEHYVRAHFGLEEQYMDQYRCPIAAQNRAAHTQLVEVLAGFRQRYAAHGFDPGESHALMRTLDQWLTDHVCRLDVQLRPYVPQP
jgi:hemerythrin-like metal-binding protein